MQDRFILTQFGAYGAAAWTGTNESGIRALCDKVVVLPDQAPAETEGGILLPEEARDRQASAATTGVLVSVGAQAFLWDSRGQFEWTSEKPEPGDRVFFVKYAGSEHIGRDGLMYRVMEYRSISGIEEPMAVMEAAE
jgi:co-chaperonin GroES (HSP10)